MSNVGTNVTSSGCLANGVHSTGGSMGPLPPRKFGGITIVRFKLEPLYSLKTLSDREDQVGSSISHVSFIKRKTSFGVVLCTPIPKCLLGKESHTGLCGPIWTHGMMILRKIVVFASGIFGANGGLIRNSNLALNALRLVLSSMFLYALFILAPCPHLLSITTFESSSFDDALVTLSKELLLVLLLFSQQFWTYQSVQ